MNGGAGPFTIVIVNDRAYPAGGASKVALESARGLAARGHDVTVLAAMGPASDDLAAAGVKTEVIGQGDLATGASPAMAIQGLWNTRAEAKLAEVLSRCPPGRTVVHIHSWSKALSPSVFAAAGRSGHPVVATLHDYGFACPNAALHIFPTGRPCTLRPMSVPCLTTNCDSRRYHHKLWRVARQTSLQHVAHAASRLHTAICVSDYSHDILRPLLPPALRTAVIDNPIDTVDEGPADPGAGDGFVYVGRFSAEKGVLLLAQATADLDLPVVFVGEGALDGEIRRINPRAVLTGWLPAAQVRARMRAGRALVIPSTWRETQGMVAPEAFAAGLPVIASSDTAPATATRQGLTGLIFRNGDLDSLKSALTAMAGDAGAARRMGRQAYAAFWSDPPTLGRHLDRLEALYAQGLADHAVRRPSPGAPSHLGDTTHA